jgi:arabinan endo-1,5-alpha-L-arabinosidase
VLAAGAVLALAALAGCSPEQPTTEAGPATKAAAPTYKNPVFEQDAPDPSLVRAADGNFYAYTSQSMYEEKLVHAPILRSPDLVRWELVGDAMPRYPEWAINDLWAPHIVLHDGTYYLYFSARQYGTGRMAIGVATATSPTGPFKEKGAPIVTGQRFYAIDPMAFAAPNGRRYLYWGSDGSPIYGQELARDGLSVVGPRHELLRPSDRVEYERLIEGAWMLRHGRFYYLMYSGDDCCSDDARYAVGVARGPSPLGPFTKFRGNPILAANSTAWAPGHNATIRDGAGQDWIVYHARVRGDPTDLRYLFIDRISWKDGWPQVNDGKGPSSTPQPAPPVG